MISSGETAHRAPLLPLFKQAAHYFCSLRRQPTDRDLVLWIAKTNGDVEDLPKDRQGDLACGFAPKPLPTAHRSFLLLGIWHEEREKQAAADKERANGGGGGGPAAQAGAVLIFLPGIKEITNCHEALLETAHFQTGNNREWLVTRRSSTGLVLYPICRRLTIRWGPGLQLPLHSTLSSEDQRKIFNRPPPGALKVKPDKHQLCVTRADCTPAATHPC